MTISYDVIITALVVAAALAWGARAVYRSWKKGTVCSSCAHSGNCPLMGDIQDLADLQACHTPRVFPEIPAEISAGKPKKNL